MPADESHHVWVKTCQGAGGQGEEGGRVAGGGQDPGALLPIVDEHAHP